MLIIIKYLNLIAFLILTACTSYSQNNDSCQDVIKKYDPFKEDSILQTKNEKLGRKLTYKFLINEGKISLRFYFTTFTPEIIYEDEQFNIYLSDNSIIKFKLNENSYPGMLGRWLTTHDFIFVLNFENLKKLIQIQITEIKIADYDFSELSGQDKFIENLKCISKYVK